MLLRANRKRSLKARECRIRKKREKQSLTKEGRASIDMKTVSGISAVGVSTTKGGETAG